MSNDTFTNWIEGELTQRGWSPAELARRANIAQSHLSRVLSGMRGAGPDLCTGIAQAFALPPEAVFRKAGLLPPEQEHTSQEREAVHLLRELSPERREYILTTMRALARSTPASIPETAE
jgi:transcriptional regulator with XRE-family HTH domain